MSDWYGVSSGDIMRSVEAAAIRAEANGEGCVYGH